MIIRLEQPKIDYNKYLRDLFMEYMEERRYNQQEIDNILWRYKQYEKNIRIRQIGGILK